MTLQNHIQKLFLSLPSATSCTVCYRDNKSILMLTAIVNVCVLTCGVYGKNKVVHRNAMASIHSILGEKGEWLQKRRRLRSLCKSPRTIWNKLRMKSFGLAFFDDDFWTSLCCCRPWFTNLKEIPKGCALLSAFLRTCCSTATLS